jgi:glycosyltransferase involved in cell wall biosynthesis
VATTLWKILKQLSLLKRFKVRHFKLGFKGLVKLASFHLAEYRNTAKFHPRMPSNRGWLINDSTLTILMTVYNQSGEELKNSISSARLQTGAKVNIIIFDDGSTRQETITFLEAFNCGKNEILIRSDNKGVIVARNELIELVTSDFILFLDPDDFLNQDYVLEAFKLLEEDRTVEIVYPNVLVHDTEKKEYTLWETGPFEPEILLKTNTLPMSSIISTRLIRNLGGYSSEFQHGPEDWDLWVRAALSGAIARHLPVIGYTYTKAIESRSSRALDQSELIWLRRVGHETKFPFHEKNTIDVFLLAPWLPRIGGVEKYVKVLAEDLTSAGLKTVIVLTEADPFNYVDDSQNYREKGNLLVKRSEFQSDEDFMIGLNRLASSTSVSINFGAPWAFSNSKKLGTIFKYQVCFIFNHETSLERALDHMKDFDEFWVAYNSLMSKILPSKNISTRTIYTGITDRQNTLLAERNTIFTVGFFGRLSPEKNPDAFIDLAKELENDPNFRFVIAGEGPLEKSVVDKAKKLKNLEYLGYVENYLDFFCGIDCLVISSEVEGIPLSAMESLSLGIPILSKPVGGISELISSEAQGQLWNGSTIEGVQAIRSIRELSYQRNTSNLLDLKFQRRITSQLVVSSIKKLQTGTSLYDDFQTS